QRIRVNFDPEWVQTYVGSRLQSFFDHDFVFIADAADRFLYASLGLRSVDPNWFNTIRPDVRNVLDLVRGRGGFDAGVASAQGTVVYGGTGRNSGAPRAFRLQRFLSPLAIVAAVAVVAPDDMSANPGAAAPVVMSVKFIDEEVLAAIASSLQLRNLRQIEKEPEPGKPAPASPTHDDHVFDLKD